MTVMLSDQPTLKTQATRLWKRDELPNALKWLEELSPLHYRLAIIDLHNAVSQACLTDGADDWVRVAELLEDWEATAELDAVNGRRLEFRLIMVDEQGREVARGRHRRVVVDRARFRNL